MNKTRQPAVAGLFYPEHRATLQTMITTYLNDAEVSTKVPKAMIAPHAGYVYSGPIAASAYCRLKAARKVIERVVIFGPSHRFGFDGLAVSSYEEFITPLGSIPIAKEEIDKITPLPFVHVSDQAHQLEHSIEVHLPFLQVLLDHFSLVPVLTGDAQAEQVFQVLQQLWGGPETLIIISSDLSHYHDYATAQQLDKVTSNKIEHLQAEQLGYDSACGRIAVAGLLLMVSQISLSMKTIDLRNSGDTAGDKNRVVGYGAYVTE